MFSFYQSQRGGGKSTSATNTALRIANILWRAGASNPRVLLIDTDSQAHATLVTTGQGRALQHNGQVYIDSIPGRGTRITIIIPCESRLTI